MYCFFCCKILPKEEIYCQSDTEKEQVGNDLSQTSTKISDNCDNSNYEDEVIRYNIKSVLQISHYLKLPKHELELTKETGRLSTFKFCQNCNEISGKLEELCGILEIIQMKINYYLNLLTDQILQKDDQIDHLNINLSNFQQVFHNKCLSKLAKVDPNPVLQLTKCGNRPIQNDTQVYLEETDVYDDDHNSTLEGNEDKTLCENANQKQSTNLVNVPNSTKKDHKRAPVKCEFCGKMITYKNISAHKRNLHGINAHGKVTLPEYLARKKLKRCEFCGRMVSSRYYGRHQKEHCGGKIGKMGKGGEGEVEENNLVKICEFCGKGVLRDKYGEHVEIWCEVKKRMADLGELEMLQREENLRCNGCGERFVNGRDIRCHLKINDKCKVQIECLE